MVQAISDSCHADDMKLFSATVTAKWKNILRREKYASLQEEGSSIKEYYQQELQRKDDLIQQLLDRCVQSEDLSKAAYTSYIENLQNIILSMESQLQTSYGDFTTTVKELFEDFRFDCDHIDQSAYKHVHEYQDNIKRIELHEQEDLDQQALHCESIIDDIETKASYEMESIRSNLDAKIEDLEDKLTTASTEFLKRTDCTSEELKMLVSQGEALSSELKQTKHSIHDLKRSIHNLKKYSELDSKNGLELSLASVHQKDHTTQRYQSIKEELVTSRKAHGRKLKTLALQAHNYKTELSKRLVKLERIVKQGHLFFPFKENKHPSKISVGQDTISVEHDTNDGFFQRSKNIVPPTASSIKKRLSNLDLHLQRCNCIKNELKCLKKEENHLQIRKEKLKVGCFICLLCQP